MVGVSLAGLVRNQSKLASESVSADLSQIRPRFEQLVGEADPPVGPSSAKLGLVSARVGRFRADVARFWQGRLESGDFWAGLYEVPLRARAFGASLGNCSEAALAMPKTHSIGTAWSLVELWLDLAELALRGLTAPTLVTTLSHVVGYTPKIVQIHHTQFWSNRPIRRSSPPARRGAVSRTTRPMFGHVWMPARALRIHVPLA